MYISIFQIIRLIDPSGQTIYIICDVYQIFQTVWLNYFHFRDNRLFIYITEKGELISKIKY